MWRVLYSVEEEDLTWKWDFYLINHLFAKNADVFQLIITRFMNCHIVTFSVAAFNIDTLNVVNMTT